LRAPTRKIQETRFGPLVNLCPWALTGSLRTLEFLGTHFKTPLGIENFLTLQNLTKWFFFI